MIYLMNSKVIEDAAKKEIEEENFRKAIEKEKERLKRPWYKKLFPWKVTIKIERR